MFQYYFFAKSDLDLSIDFFRIYFVSFKLFFSQILCFYSIITTLDGGGGQGRNKQKRYRQTLLVTDAGSQLTSEIGEGGEVGISTNFTDAGSQLREGGRAGIRKNVIIDTQNVTHAES